MDSATLEGVASDLDHALVADLLDSVPDPTCEVHLGSTLDSPVCGKPAAWLSTALPCGHSAYYCAKCRAHAKRMLDRPGTRPGCPLHSPVLPISLEWVAL